MSADCRVVIVRTYKSINPFDAACCLQVHAVANDLI